MFEQKYHHRAIVKWTLILIRHYFCMNDCIRKISSGDLVHYEGEQRN